ncbi:outer membrane protein assembly factor BamD [bacterium]|nr:outer membrane protein assembly factor BamD [bacterium]MBU1957566.1 outer membrane protein assembly factor BamD [bacterium]
MNVKQTLFVILFATLFLGCSGKDTVKEYDKPALYWYQAIVKEVASSNLDKADNYYISLRSEHMRSPLLPTATMILAQAHMEDQAYIMADYYLDEYLKKYASGKRVEQAKFLKIKAAFLGIKDINKDQKLMIDTLNEVERFVKAYPKSSYLAVVQTLKVRLNMAQYMLNENIASLYSRIGKDDAAALYRDKNANSPLNIADIKAPEVGLVDSVFN